MNIKEKITEDDWIDTEKKKAENAHNVGLLQKIYFWKKTDRKMCVQGVK